MKKCSPEEPVTLGKPIANAQCYIMDNRMKLVPIGVTGELYIGGAGVARGYLNNPDLTNSKFQIPNYKQIPNPKSQITNKEENYPLSFSASQLPSFSLYRTGDLARWLPSGEIDFLGRMDHQVKVRGFRIELGEIETRLLKHAGIREAVVTGRKSEEGETYLCAYFAADHPDTPDKIPGAMELREYLSEQLPDYMIPAHFVLLEKIPLTANGKTDYNALPPPETAAEEAEYVPPATEMEDILVNIWAEVLALEKENVGVTANFFEIGGDSIKVIQISARLRKHDLKLESGEIFRNPTIQQLGPLVQRTSRIIEQAVVEGEVKLTPVQHWFFREVILHRHHYNQAVMLYSGEGFDPEAVETVFKKIQEHHDALRMTYKEVNGKIVQMNHGVDYPFSLEVYDFRRQAQPAAALGQKADEIQAGINLETGPLLKLGLFHLDDGDRLLIVVHHLVMDGISWRILFEDIDTLYQQYQQGNPLELPLKTDSFKYWAEQLHQYADSDAFLEEKDYWLQLESTAADTLTLPKDFAGENRFKDAVTLSFRLNPAETEQLLTKTNEAFGTETFNQPRLLVAMEGHGRESILKDVDINRTLGWFTSIHPMLLEFPGQDQATADYASHIKETKERLRRVPHKGIGHGILKYLTSEENKGDMDSRLTPEIGFNYLGQFGADVGKMAFDIAGESTGHMHSREEKREHPLEISGMVTDNQLTMSITYGKKQYKPETIENLKHHYQAELKAIIAFCTSKKEKELTPSDFTYDKLSSESIDAIDAMFNQ
jgi:non-ribosomal peptide synthase protein (TIGR01720 family)